MKSLLYLLVSLTLVGLMSGPAQAQTRAQSQVGPAVEVFTLSGVLDRPTLGALRRAVDASPGRGTRVLLIQLDSFGGLGTDPAAVESVVAGARVPVAVWVGPRGAQAAGAAAFLLARADAVVVSHQARIGPALPAELGRGRHASAEAALFAASGLPAATANGTVSGADAVRSGLAAYEAESLPAAITGLNGRRADGAVIQVPGFEVRFLSQSLFDRVRHGLANPTLAYLLLLAAACCLSFEWFQTGFGVAGVAGLLIGLLGLYSLLVLPTNWAAFGALAAGMVLFTADAAASGLGLVTVAGTALSGVGSWWLFSSPSPVLRVDGRLAVLGTLWLVAWFVVILTVVLRSQRQMPVAGEALVGASGVVRSVLNPGGVVVVDGAVWRAELADGGLLPTGQRVTVGSVVDGVLRVNPQDPSALRPARRRPRRLQRAR
jgi:membrane-bound serine protease (ClpP class)